MKNNSTSPMTMPSVGERTIAQLKENDMNAQNKFEALYLEKNYKDAAQYLIDNKEAFSSGIYNYNLGTVYLKLEDFAQARFYLEKALKEGNLDSATLNNLNYTKVKLDVDDLTTSTLIPDKVVNFFSSIPQVGYISISLMFILIGLLIIRLYEVQKKRALILILAISLAPLIFGKLYVDDMTKAIALKNISLYEGPSKIFSEKGEVKAGSKVILGESKEGWIFVEFPVSLAGWIEKKDLGIY